MTNRFIKMENESEILSITESRHRKEKKELQAHIQSLKKSAKNDKTKKKELTAEMARLESELDIRHKHEIEALEKEPEVNHIDEEADIDAVTIKLSKAQRRRDKKSQQDKERDEQIKLQEQENLYGPRNIEMQTLRAKVQEKQLKIFSIPSDGDCLYKAVAHQLETIRKQVLTVGELRKHTSNHIRQNKDDFIQFMSNPETFEMLTDEEFEEYCHKIIDSKVWGGQLEIRALSNSLKCPISVIQATGPGFIEQGTEFAGPPLIITYHRHMYSLGEHYNSTYPVDSGASY